MQQAGRQVQKSSECPRHPPRQERQGMQNGEAVGSSGALPERKVRETGSAGQKW